MFFRFPFPRPAHLILVHRTHNVDYRSNKYQMYEPALFSCNKLLNPFEANSLYLLCSCKKKNKTIERRASELKTTDFNERKFSIKHISLWHLFNPALALRWYICGATNLSIRNNSEYANKSFNFQVIGYTKCDSMRVTERERGRERALALRWCSCFALASMFYAYGLEVLNRFKQ